MRIDHNKNLVYGVIFLVLISLGVKFGKTYTTIVFIAALLFLLAGISTIIYCLYDIQKHKDDFEFVPADFAKNKISGNSKSQKIMGFMQMGVLASLIGVFLIFVTR